VARPELSLVIPIYNEEEVLPQLDVRLQELLAKLATDTEVVFVNDGSKDQSIDILRRMASHEPRYRVLGFSRNFGHQRAITAGMEKSRGRAVVVMDADLQDPPEVILEMVAKWREGYDVVYGRRKSRAGESAFKLATAKIFYRVFAAMIPIEVPLDTGDFRLMSRRVVQTMRGLRETHRFVRGLVAWVGFKQTAVEYDRAARAAGETKYPLRKMLAFAIDGIASFSIQPLRFATYIGVFVGTASVLYAIASTITYYAGMNVPGWTTTVVLVSFLFSVQFFMIGVLGEYVGRIYEQVKRRPLYVVSERINFGRRKVERIITQDLDEVKEGPSTEPSLAAASPAAPEGASGSVIPPPVKLGQPGALPGLGKPAGSSTLSRPPPPVRRSASIPANPVTPPPRPVTGSIPPLAKSPSAFPATAKAGSVPPSMAPSAAPGKSASIPSSMRSPAAPVAKSPSVPPPKPGTPATGAGVPGARFASAGPNAKTLFGLGATKDDRPKFGSASKGVVTPKVDPAKKPDAKVDAPKVDAPKADAPKPDAAKGHSPTVETARADLAKKSEAPKGESAKGESAKAEAGKAETPKAEASKAESAKGESAKGESTKGKATKADAPKGEKRDGADSAHRVPAINDDDATEDITLRREMDDEEAAHVVPKSEASNDDDTAGSVIRRSGTATVDVLNNDDDTAGWVIRKSDAAKVDVLKSSDAKGGDGKAAEARDGVAPKASAASGLPALDEYDPNEDITAVNKGMDDDTAAEDAESLKGTVRALAGKDDGTKDGVADGKPGKDGES
jgi:dolichol-phosphate mannosyltransferase